MNKSHNIDYPLLVIVSILLILGILILSGVSADFSQENFENSYYYLIHQLIWGLLIGVVLGLVAYKIPIAFFKKWSWIFVLSSLFLMALIFIPGLSFSSGGAPRWINLGFFSFQPSEFLKISFILYLSAWLSSHTFKKQKNKERKKCSETLLPFFVILGLIFILLFFQSDASTLILIFVIALLMYFFSNTPFWHSLLVFLVGLGGTAFLIIFEPYRINRILVFLKILDDPMKVGYQIKQALIAVGSGGLWGAGLGMSSQKISGILPQTMSDSIFAVLAEELGFIGSIILISLFLLFLWRGFRIAQKSRDRFSAIFALGFTSWVCIQAFINIGAIIEILPLTGIPLPFISYGGSHIVAELIGVGMLLNISRNIKK